MTSPSENITDASATVAAATWLQEDKVDDGPALPESDTPTNAAAVWANGVDKFLKQTSEVFDGTRVLAALSATTISTDDLSIGGATVGANEAIRALSPYGMAVIYDVDTDLTNKITRMATRAYNHAQTHFVWAHATTALSTNLVQIGGGTGVGQAATQVNLVTAAAVNTTTGTVRWTVNSGGHFVPGSDSIYDVGANGTQVRYVYAAALRSDSLSITNAAGTSTQITSSVSVPFWVRPANAISLFGNGSGSPANGYAKSDAGNFQWPLYAGGTADANRRWITTFNSSENLVLNRRDSGGASVEDVINIEWSSGTVYVGGTVLYHNNANADFRLGNGGGNPLFRITKSDGGAASMLYGITDTASPNRRWIHQFNSGEGLSWGRYDGAGSVDLTPLALSYTTGEVEITRIRGRGTDVEDSDFSLSSGWGSTAVVNVTEASDIRGRIELLCGGTGIGANPTVTLTFADGAFSTSPCVLTTRGDVQSPVADWRVTAQTTTGVTFTFMGTPVSGRTYILNYFVIA